MKALLAMAGGFVLSLSVFAAGAAFAIFVLGARPAPERHTGEDLAGGWTDRPHRVDTTAQALERLPARTNPGHAGTVAEAVAEGGTGPIDRTVTSSIVQKPAPPRDGRLAQFAAAHVEWCADRYRSYRPRDDSYTPYRGGRRRCVSPHSQALAEVEKGRVVRVTDPGAEGGEADAQLLGYASAGDGARLDGRDRVTSDHVRRCSARYRSYRAEDNSYQPHGGGPRRQCGTTLASGGSLERNGDRPRREISAMAPAPSQNARLGDRRHPAGRPRFDPHRGGR